MWRANLYLSHILHQWQERYALPPLVRVSAARCAAETRLMRMVQDLSYPCAIYFR